MSWLHVLVSFTIFANLWECFSTLPPCTENVQKIGLCSLTPFYNKDFPTDPYPQELATSIAFTSVAEFNDILRTIQIDLTLSTSWHDDRVTLNDNSTDWYGPNADETNDLFFPTIAFHGAKSIMNEAKYGPRNLNYFWFEYKTLRFVYRQSMKVAVYCDFDFSEYPFDSHDCELNYGLTGITIDHMLLLPPMLHVNKMDFSFGSPSVKMDQSILPFDIRIKSQASYAFLDSGYNYSYTGMTLHFKRHELGLLTGSFYIPTLIFTCLSLISYSIHPEVVPGRLGLLITLYLIASNVYNSVQGPPSRGFSYIEVWMIGVQVPMLTAIYEYGLLLVIRRKQPTIIRDIDSFCDQCDKVTFWISCGFIIIFNVVYWFVVTGHFDLHSRSD